MFPIRLKKLLSLALITAMVLSAGGTAMAVNIAPRWNNVNACTANLSFSGTTASCEIYIRGESGTTQIDPKITLQKENTSGSFSADTSWEPVAVNGASFSWSGTRSNCTSGVEYRLKVEADVTRNGATETIVVYSPAKTCP